MASMFSTSEAFNIALKFLSTSVSLAGILVILRTVAGEVILEHLRSYFVFLFRYLFTRSSTNLTLVINKSKGMSRNEVYDAAKLYLPTKVSPKTKRLRLSKTKRQKDFAISIEKDENIVDIFDGIELKWRYCIESKEESSEEKKFFELSFNKKFKHKVIDVYLRDVLKRAEKIKDNNKVIKIYTCGRGSGSWDSMILEHPATFDSLAMEATLRDNIIHDLNRFKKRKEFYKKVGKAWKRGYLLYGPPGTGKSTLIAAMANHLNFDIYDLELTSIHSNSDLRKVLLSTTNRSIIVIEDIDCSALFEDRENHLESVKSNGGLTLSGILNCIDGLWSSCGDEKIIVFTTNHKNKLDPALLRPGRADMHICMSYCTPYGFRVLAANYLGIEYNERFGEVEAAIKRTKVTPAEVAEQLMRNEDDLNALLNGLIQFLTEKKGENEEAN